MEWDEALSKIIKGIKVGTNLNTENSNHRYVSEVPRINQGKFLDDIPSYCVTYDKKGQKLRFTIEMLKTIYHDTEDNNCIYNKNVFKKNYEKLLNHGCNVHIVGMIFVKAGFAEIIDKRNYKINKQ